MSINKFKVFTYDRILIYLGACGLFPLLACLQAFRFNYLESTNGIPLPGWLAMIGALLGFALGDTMLFKARNDFKKQITGYSDSGVGVLMPSWPSSLPAFETVVKDIDAATTEIVTFWQKFYPGTSDKMEAYVNGSILGFTSQVIDLTVHAPGAQLIIPNGFERWAVGSTAGQYMSVMWLVGDTWTTVLNRVKHELSHVCLNGISILDSDQDNIMSVDKFPY